MTQVGTVVNHPDDLIPLDAAAEKFGVSRRTLYRLAAIGAITRYRRAGDRRTFVSTSEVARAVGFRPAP